MPQPILVIERDRGRSDQRDSTISPTPPSPRSSNIEQARTSQADAEGNCVAASVDERLLEDIRAGQREALIGARKRAGQPSLVRCYDGPFLVDLAR